MQILVDMESKAFLVLCVIGLQGFAAAGKKLSLVKRREKSKSRLFLSVFREALTSDDFQRVFLPDDLSAEI